LTSSKPFRTEAHTRVKQDMKGLDKKLRQQILEEYLPEIEEDPYRGYPLAHEFKGLWSYHLRYHGTDYRIVYEILPVMERAHGGDEPGGSASDAALPGGAVRRPPTAEVAREPRDHRLGADP